MNFLKVIKKKKKLFLAVIIFLIIVFILGFSDKPVKITLSSSKTEAYIGEKIDIDYTVTNKSNTNFDTDKHRWDVVVFSPKNATSGIVIQSDQKNLGPKETIKGKLSWQIDKKYLKIDEGEVRLQYALSKLDENGGGTYKGGGELILTIKNAFNSLSGNVDLSKTANINHGDNIKVNYSLINDSPAEIGGADIKLRVGYRIQGRMDAFSPIAKFTKIIKPNEKIDDSYNWLVYGVPSPADYEFVLQIIKDDPNDFVVYKEFTRPFTFFKIN